MSTKRLFFTFFRKSNYSQTNRGLQDKVSRMQNLLLKELKGEGGVNHESLEDTYKDAANYGMIGLILKRGLWK